MIRNIAAVLLMILCPIYLQAEAPVIGMVDSQKIMEESAILREIRKQSGDLNQRLDKFNMDRHELISKTPPDQRQRLEKEFDKKKKGLEAEVEVNKKRWLSYVEKIRGLVKTLAIKHKITTVYLRPDLVVLTGDQLDMTDEVIAEINKDKFSEIEASTKR